MDARWMMKHAPHWGEKEWDAYVMRISRWGMHVALKGLQRGHRSRVDRRARGGLLAGAAMSARQSAEVTKALRMVERGSTAYAAARKCGIALSTIYRALKRKRERPK